MTEGQVFNAPPCSFRAWMRVEDTLAQPHTIRAGQGPGPELELPCALTVPAVSTATVPFSQLSTGHSPLEECWIKKKQKKNL